MAIRLPLQVGRAAMAQSARFAATVWLGPLLMLAGAAVFSSASDDSVGGWTRAIGDVLGLVISAVGFLCAAIAVDAYDVAKRDRPSDLVLDEQGLSIAGGDRDGQRMAWADVRAHGCELTRVEPRRSAVWWLADLLTARRIGSISRRVRVPVYHVILGPLGMIAEGEGDEQDSLEQLRDAILGAATPAAAPGTRLPQEILTCPQCGAPQVPVAAPTMPCPACGHVLEVPSELRERVRAQAALDRTAAPSAAIVAKLVAQVSARRAGRVVRACRRLMVWSQPIAMFVLGSLLSHQCNNDVGGSALSLEQVVPGEDGTTVYDLALFAVLVAGWFCIAWLIGRTYVSSRRALRTVAESFGAVPPIAPGAPSTCHECGAPLPAGELVVRCAYCAAENVLGIDPRPAAMRRSRDHVDLAHALRHRRRARRAFAIAVPLSALAALAMAREVRLAWHAPSRVGHDASSTEPLCGILDNSDDNLCGTLTNHDLLRHTVTVHQGDLVVSATILPRGQLRWTCTRACTFEVGASRAEAHTNDARPADPLEIRGGVVRSAPEAARDLGER